MLAQVGPPAAHKSSDGGCRWRPRGGHDKVLHHVAGDPVHLPRDVQPRVVQERPPAWRSRTMHHRGRAFHHPPGRPCLQVNPEALRRRVDRGTIRAAKGRDGTRRITNATSDG